VEIEIISVHWNRFIFELNNDLYAFVLDARGKVQQRMLVEAQLVEDAVETGSGGFGHKGIVEQAVGAARASGGRAGNSQPGRKLFRTARDPLRLRSGQAFGCVVASLREPTTSLRMTNLFHKSLSHTGDLFVAQGFDGVEAGGFDRGQHAAHDSYEAEDCGRPNQSRGVNIEVDIAFVRVFDKGAPKSE